MALLRGYYWTLSQKYWPLSQKHLMQDKRKLSATRIDKNRLYWKLYLWDEVEQRLVTFTNLQCNERADGHLDIPRLPVLLAINILYDEPAPRAVISHDRNYYGLIAGREWCAMTLSGLHNYIDTYTGNGCIKRGVVVDNDVWRKYFDQARVDPEVQKVVNKVGQRKIDRDRE